jgi:peptidoglycan hydrolase-like protein with peptidoglycan-binding domain
MKIDSVRYARNRKMSFVVALLAVALMAWGALEAARSADAATRGSGGVTSGGGLNLTESVSKPTLAPRFGTRVLRQGMTGPDVRVLKGMVRAQSLLRGTGVNPRFDAPTTSAVRRFQKRKKISASGVVNRYTARRLVGSMRTSGASWYGPGFYGNRTACGQTLRRGTQGVAHKTLPCGTKVLIGHRGRFVITRVIDRGPYVHGRSWDLTNATRKALKVDGVGSVRHAVVKRG